ncbi:MAG TPA: aminotransferase class V-fold PLP-dependent enzyme, partial [Gemmatimonadaceae bacterium]|nr:aminotransferase class V-fold PLP-dependent enzyme [Gemmatimonadaceae bacterium]
MNVKADFPIFTNNPGLHYLDSAATSQKPESVIDAVVDFYENSNANPHRGAYALSVE